MKKVLKILTLIMLILTILKISDTYAKYYSLATATLEQDIGKWVIKLNNQDIYSEKGKTVRFDIIPADITESTNTSPGKLAPGTSWYNDITIDPTGTDVAVRYDVEVDISHITDIDVEYQLLMAEGTKTLIKTAEHTYTGIISLEEVQAGKLEKIRCSIVWHNNEEKNLIDTELASEAGKSFEIPVKITCTQYIGENITPYR